MSADLFAEFGSTPAPTQEQRTVGNAQSKTQPASTTFSFFDDLSNPGATGRVTQGTQHPSVGIQPGNYGKSETPIVDDNDDDWGDFEGGSSSFDPAPPVKQDLFTPSVPQTSQPSQTSWETAGSQNDPFSFIAPQPPQQTSTAWQKAPVLKAKKSADPSVLFDAEDEFDDDDDFGDFEGSGSIETTRAPPKSSAGVVDLLGGLDLSGPTSPTAGRTGGTTTTNTPSLLSSTNPKNNSSAAFGSVSRTKQTKAAPTVSTEQQEDSWDTFDDWEASIPTKAPAKTHTRAASKKVTVEKAISSPPPILSPTFDNPQAGELPPTNVPPPAILLTLFPPLFADAQDKLFKPMAAQTLPMRNKLLSEPTTIAYLQGYLMLASVAAHVIAGRKLRWKRDQHLSQGMRIGPASSRATSGMKLSTIDKSENMKEEREASDVVRAWKEQIGRLRHVVSAANQIRAGTLGAVPDIQETMPVKVLKQGEGGVPAQQPCMLCGLKRDERVGAVDQGVEDSFGEWWIEQVNMHRGMLFQTIVRSNANLLQAVETCGTNTKIRSGKDEVMPLRWSTYDRNANVNLRCTCQRQAGGLAALAHHKPITSVGDGGDCDISHFCRASEKRSHTGR